MNALYYYPINNFQKKSSICSLEKLIIIFNIICNLFSRFGIFVDLLIASDFYHKNEKIYLVTFTIFSLFKYSSLVYQWVIIGVYQYYKALSPCFRKASIIMLITYLACVVPYTIIFLIILILKGSRNLSLALFIQDPFFFLYLIPHFLLIISLSLNLKFVIDQKISNDEINAEKEIQN